ncbi:MAG: phosphotransferase [Clostridiaceae bacterium]|nr:phosphotransferase [Clostridiaceae bacterium]
MLLKDKLKDRIKLYLLDTTALQQLKLKRNFTVNFLAQGEYNINFTLDDGENKYVFRVNTGSQLELENQIQYEYDALKTLEVSGVTPKVYIVDGSKKYLEYGILVMEFLEGKPLQYDQDLKKAANIFGKIHSLNLNHIDTSNFIVEEHIFSDRVVEGKRLLQDYLTSPIVNKELKDFFYKFLQWSEKNRHKEKYFIENKWHVINNTEVNSHNFIIGNENSYLIDWEKPVISDPTQDLTQFLAVTTTLWKGNTILNKEEKQGFFETYTKALGGDNRNIQERVHLYTPYLYLRALSWCAYAWLEYHNPDKAIKNMDTFNKIEAYLNINFLNKLLKEYI